MATEEEATTPKGSAPPTASTKTQAPSQAEVETANGAGAQGSIAVILNHIAALEEQASVLARNGFDVTDASKELDGLRRQLQHDVPINLTLNRVRLSLAKAEGRQRFLHSPWPALMFVYELLILTGWAVLIGFLHTYIYRNYVEQSVWPLLVSLPPAAAVGSIASSSYALTSLYRHIADRTLDAGLSTWYLIKPVIGAVAGSFIGIIGSVVLNVVGASGDSAHAVFLGVAYLAGANPDFTENLTSQFRQRVLGGSNSKPSSNSSSNSGSNWPA